MSRPPRPEYVTKTTIYLTREQKIARRKILADIEVARPGVDLESKNDAVGYSLTELAKTLELEKLGKK